MPDVMDVPDSPGVPDHRVLGVDQRRHLAGLVGQTLGREAPGFAKLTVGRADGARAETRQPEGIVQLVRQLLAQEGLTAALEGFQHPIVAATDRAPGQGPHDLEHLAGVFLVAGQFAEGAECLQRLETLGTQTVELVEIGGGGHGRAL